MIHKLICGYKLDIVKKISFFFFFSHRTILEKGAGLESNPKICRNTKLNFLQITMAYNKQCQIIFTILEEMTLFLHSKIFP